MSTLVCVAAALLCVVPFSVGSFGVCRVPGIRANGEFFKAAFVFTGTVTSQRYVERENGSGWYYQIQVKQVFKGAPHLANTVYSDDSDVRFPLETGGNYLLFIYRRNGRLEIDSCGNSALLSEAGESLKMIQGIAASENGEIEGWIAPETAGIDLAGIHVVVSGARTYHAMTGSDGYFHFRAPPGKYTVDFSNHEYYVNSLDLFWYGPRQFTLHAGESASLQFVSVRHRQQ